MPGRGKAGRQKKGWGQARQGELLPDGVEQGIAETATWTPTEEEHQELRRKNRGSLEQHRDRMRYGTFRAKGDHIGSGRVESACKMVVGQRLQQAGRHGSSAGAEAMLCLRPLLLNAPTADLRPYARSWQ